MVATSVPWTRPPSSTLRPSRLVSGRSSSPPGGHAAVGAACSRCAEPPEAEGFTSLELMATLPGVPLTRGWLPRGRARGRHDAVGVVLEFVRMRRKATASGDECRQGCRRSALLSNGRRRCRTLHGDVFQGGPYGIPVRRSPPWASATCVRFTSPASAGLAMVATVGFMTLAIPFALFLLVSSAAAGAVAAAVAIRATLRPRDRHAWRRPADGAGVARPPAIVRAVVETTDRRRAWQCAQAGRQLLRMRDGDYRRSGPWRNRHQLHAPERGRRSSS